MTTTGPWLEEVGSALSRLLNALTRGDGAVTFSARCWGDYYLAPTRFNEARVRFIDWLHHRDPDHCRNAWIWHAARGLV